MSLECWILALGACGVWQSKFVQGLRAWDGALETQFTNSLPLLVIDLVFSSTPQQEKLRLDIGKDRPVYEAVLRSFQTLSNESQAQVGQGRERVCILPHA